MYLFFCGKPVSEKKRIPPTLLLAMKLTAILLTVAFLQVQAHGYSQKLVTLNVQNASLKSVFNQITKQTGYVFFYEQKIIEQYKAISIKVTNAPLDEVLQFCFKDLPLTYNVIDNVIVVKQRVAAPAPSQNPQQQTGAPIDITGKVTDADGKPLPGANIKVRGTNVGATTDNEGRFTLRNVEENSVLEISYVDHETKTFTVRGAGFINIALEQKLSVLDETQVIGYGTTTRRFNTGNVSSVKASDIDKQPVNNPLLALQGRVPGVTIIQENGIPGGPVTIRVQGQNSILKGNDPLIVVDGVPYPTTTTTMIGGVLGMGSSPGMGFQPTTPSPLSYINPKDIESIDVLKDADATAIYGSRAANGAILITTKKGKVGNTKVDVNLQQGWGKVNHFMNLLNTQQYVQMRREAFSNDNVTPTVSNAPDLVLWDTTQYTNWQKALIGNTAQYTNVNATVSGGVQTIQYLVGATYNRQTTVFPGDFADQKGTVHFNLNGQSSNRKLQLQLSGNYLQDDNFLPSVDLTNKAVLTEPDAPKLYNDDGSLNWALNPAGNSTIDNPLAPVLYQTYRNKTNNLISNLVFSYIIVNGLEFKTSLGYNNLQSEEYTPTPLNAIRPQNRNLVPSQRTAQFGNSWVKTFIIEPQINYKRTIGKGALQLLAGSTVQQSNNKTIYMGGSGYSSDQLLGSISLAPTISVSQSASLYKYNAIFSRLNYSFKNKYIIDLTGRRDASSRFGNDNKFHNFGSIGAAWIFSDETFFQKYLSFISYGKLKGSYGTTGSDQIGDYQYLNTYSSVSAQVPYQGTSGLQPARLYNSHLQWEETKKMQVGADLGFIKDKILLSIVYARNRSSNEVLSYALPTITGYSSIASNFPATIQNTSWEFSINTINTKTKNFNWKSSVNLTIPRNKVTNFPNIDQSSYASGTNGVIVGQPLGIIKAFRFNGVDAATGQYTFLDNKGSTTFSPAYPDDATALINLLPKYYGGIQNTVFYKGFQLDFLFQFVKQIGSSYRFENGNYYNPGRFFRALSNQDIAVLDHWQKAGDVAAVQKYSTFSRSSDDIAQGSDEAYIDASYIRLKSLSLSWQLPQQWYQYLKMQDVRIYFQGQNLWTVTKYKGLDPEVQNIQGLSPLKIWTFGINLNF